MDLVTLNLFRGREVGVPTYNQAVTCYGTQQPQVPSTSPQNKDLILGLLSEPLAPGSSLPTTIAHIWAEVFARLREFDPSFYTKRKDQFLEVNYDVVKRTTLSGLLERNTDAEGLKVNAFMV